MTDITPITTRLRAVLSARHKQLIEAETEIARLQQRVKNLTVENEMLSIRLAQAEDGYKSPSHS